MPTSLSGDGLFDLPADARREPLARIVILAGASGTGKTRLASRSGLPVVGLDNFYYDGDRAGLPVKNNVIDWDDIATWNRREAMAALIELCTRGSAIIPVYDIPSNSKVHEQQIELDGSRIVIAEGIFSAHLIEDVRDEGLLADAMAIVRPRIRTAWFRLMRDLDEQRKSTGELVRRGLHHLRAEPELNKEFQRLGARLVTDDEARTHIQALAHRTN